MNSLNIVETSDKILSQYSVFYFVKIMFIRVRILLLNHLLDELKCEVIVGCLSLMDTPFENTYDLTLEQLENLDLAEDLMLKNDLGAAERLLLEMLSEDEECIPVLSNLGHLYGRHLSEFETAIEYYNQVLQLEPDNAWARDARRRYLRYVE
jgi:tetratricopeptide (TPR) repeat protein